MRLGYFKGRDSKYNARPTRCREGIMHHSAMESARCDELHLLTRAVPPIISDLEAHPQPRFSLDVNGVHITNYLADFAYTDVESGQKIVEDVKGFRTETFRLKALLMLACHGVEISVVTRVRRR